MFEYINQRGQSYYLNKTFTKKGNERILLSKTKKTNSLSCLPQGYEIFENPNGQAYLRKIQECLIANDEIELVEKEISKFKDLKYYRLFRDKNEITFYSPNQDVEMFIETLPSWQILGDEIIKDKIKRFISFMPFFKFILIDKVKRIFQAQRFCYRSSIDDWIIVGKPCELKIQTQKYIKHFTKDSLYELF